MTGQKSPGRGTTTASERRTLPGMSEEALPPLGSVTRPASKTPPAYKPKKPDASPGGYIFGGFVLMVIGTALNAFSSDVINLIGLLLAGTGALIASIGTIAEGVRLGARWVDFDRK